MPWARFEDDYLGNPKLAGLSTAAIALDMAAIVFSSRELRDGEMDLRDIRVVAELIHLRRISPTVQELVNAKRWEVLDDGSGYRIHDYLAYQPSRQRVLSERAAAVDRMRRVRANNGRTAPAGSPEVRKKFNDPGPGPGPGPERSTNVPLTSPLPPPQAEGAAPSLAPAEATNENTVAMPPRPPRNAKPPTGPACCPNFAATGFEHWQFCPSAVGVEA